MDCSPPCSSVPGIFQARALEWVAISFSRASSRPRDRTRISRTAGRHSTIWATSERTRKNRSQCSGHVVATTHLGPTGTGAATVSWRWGDGTGPGATACRPFSRHPEAGRCHAESLTVPLGPSSREAGLLTWDLLTLTAGLSASHALFCPPHRPLHRYTHLLPPTTPFSTHLWAARCVLSAGYMESKAGPGYA